MLQLIEPSTCLHAAWLECHREWGPGKHEDGFGVHASGDVDSPEGFAGWVQWLRDRDDPERAAFDGRPPCRFRWMTEDGEVLGGIALRHWLDDRSQALGHIGYGVRPSARGRGVASFALGHMLDEARALGLQRVRLVCDDGNGASRKVIERAGGVLEDIVLTEHGRVRRHWIAL